MRKLSICVAVLGLIACHAAQKKAVEQAIQDHLKANTRLVAGSYNTKVERVGFNGDTAEALVRFESRQSAKLFVEVDYGLQLENGRWEVVSSNSVGGLKRDSHRPGEESPPVSPKDQPALTPQASH